MGHRASIETQVKKIGCKCKTICSILTCLTFSILNSIPKQVENQDKLFALGHDFEAVSHAANFLKNRCQQKKKKTFFVCDILFYLFFFWFRMELLLNNSKIAEEKVDKVEKSIQKLEDKQNKINEKIDNVVKKNQELSERLEKLVKYLPSRLLPAEVEFHKQLEQYKNQLNNFSEYWKERQERPQQDLLYSFFLELSNTSKLKQFLSSQNLSVNAEQFPFLNSILSQSDSRLKQNQIILSEQQREQISNTIEEM